MGARYRIRLRGIFPTSGRFCLITVLLLAASLHDAGAARGIAAQQLSTLAVDLPGNEGLTLAVERHRGFAAVPARALAPLGWSLEMGPDPNEVTLSHRTAGAISLIPNFPHIAWRGELVQLAHVPYWLGNDLYLPLQLLSELLPRFLPSIYEFEADRNLLTMLGEGDLPGTFPSTVAFSPPPGPSVGSAPGPERAASTPGRAPRILVIDPGHGGSDPGAIGPSGAREADLALAIALALVREFEGESGIEVRLTRDRDVEVPLWSRGEMATEWKGDRPGVFLSLHMNALEGRPGVRGFETYFLSEARDEHERRVAALENASLPASSAAGSGGGDPLLTALIRDLQTFDHQHWSADLAELVQRELGTFHPGADRGVKQGPFAVITNALMPSVLVEVGFITSPEEERLLLRSDFHRDVARALARAVRSFFERYPPGGSS